MKTHLVAWGSSGTVSRDGSRPTRSWWLLPRSSAVAGDRAYVNAAWLVAMASPRPLDVSPAAAPPAPRTVRPYVTLMGPSLDVCVNNAHAECVQCEPLDAGVPCSGTPALTDVPDQETECEVLTQGQPLVRFEELCALYFVEDPNVAVCVARLNGCELRSVPLTSTNLATAATFVADSACLAQLDACLQGGGSGSSSGGVSSSSGGSSGPPPSTSSSAGCGGCGNCCSCGTGLGCKAGTGSCSKLCLDGQCAQCAVRSGDVPPSPWGPLWAVPLVYLLRRARRQRADAPPFSGG